jgi:hypothetical protein
MIGPRGVLLLDEIDSAMGAVLRADAFAHRRGLGQYGWCQRSTDGIRQPLGRERLPRYRRRAYASA